MPGAILFAWVLIGQNSETDQMNHLSDLEVPFALPR